MHKMLCRKYNSLTKVSNRLAISQAILQLDNIIYLITCKTPDCRSQYVGYTTRQLKFRVYEHLSHNLSCHETKHKLSQVKFQILSKAPDNIANKELWLKQNYLWISRLGTLTKLSNKGLNKLIYDPIFHSNPTS